MFSFRLQICCYYIYYHYHPVLNIYLVFNQKKSFGLIWITSIIAICNCLDLHWPTKFTNVYIEKDFFQIYSRWLAQVCTSLIGYIYIYFRVCDFCWLFFLFPLIYYYHLCELKITTCFKLCTLTKLLELILSNLIILYWLSCLFNNFPQL